LSNLLLAFIQTVTENGLL